MTTLCGLTLRQPQAVFYAARNVRSISSEIGPDARRLHCLDLGKRFAQSLGRRVIAPFAKREMAWRIGIALVSAIKQVHRLELRIGNGATGCGATRCGLSRGCINSNLG